MQFTDDDQAKYRIGAAESRVHPLPKAAGLPPFGRRRFSSCEEFNAWKQSLLRAVAAQGGVRWTR